MVGAKLLEEFLRFALLLRFLRGSAHEDDPRVQEREEQVELSSLHQPPFSLHSSTKSLVNKVTRLHAESWPDSLRCGE